MVDPISEILLPGRAIAPPAGGAPHHSSRVTLPSFIAGPENRVVAKAIESLMDDSAPVGQSRSNMPALLALYGPTGSGKTHLALGLIKYWQQRHGADSAEYFTAGDFRRALSEAFDRDAVVEFRHRVRGRRLLAIDDLHQLSADDYLHQELRYTLDDLAEAEAAVIVTSNQPFGMLDGLPADLGSRLASGLVLRLDPPGLAARQRLVEQTASALGRPMACELTNRLAGRLAGTARELIGAVLELGVGNRVGAAGHSECLDELLSLRNSRRPTIREIIGVVAKYFGQTQAVLKSASRRQSAVLPRSVAVYLARELCGLSYDDIGQALGGRDHTTIMHSYRKIDRERRQDLTIQHALDELRRILLCN